MIVLSPMKYRYMCCLYPEPVVKATASQSYAGITEADKHVADIRWC